MKVEMISVVFGTIIAAFIALGMCSLSAASAQTGPSINATNVFDSGQMILPGNAKHLVILIPNEGHHGPGEEDESRFIAQSFVPQNVVINPGTQVIWFNGDVGHEHNIVVTDESNSPVFETGEFTELQASRPFMFNNTGNFDYADTVEYEEGFVMTGNIIVIWTSAGKSLDDVTSQLVEISEGLPYE